MNSEEHDYLFGFGSIMNTSTHATWQSPDQKVAALPGSVATLKSGFGYKRRWNFRSSTGFTALGVTECTHSSEASDINGVVFQVPRSEIPNWDRREVGYKKVEVPLELLEFHSDIPGLNQQTKFSFGRNEKVWLYVPLPTHTVYADENHPLLQSYVDTVLQGCLEWGGERMAEEFIITTGGWSTYFLNDTPSSRRPWLFRKQYGIIDNLLKKYSEQTHYGDRRHPEEFASAFHQRMKGTWSIPRRNPNFTGRDHELDSIQSRLSSQDIGRQRVVAKLEVAGMGGVGKTQLVTEYCYRRFPSEYGLVVWLNAESSDSLVADYRQLLADLAAEADVESDLNKTTDEIVGEVKTRLFRSQVPWLLVFDNLEDHDLLEKFVPRGAGMKGHVLVTTRHVEVELGAESNCSLILGCFNISESLELLRRVSPHNMEGHHNADAAEALCERLGNLPLALGMAAAYMQRCDVQCVEYLDRFITSEKTGQSLLRHGKLQDYSLTVASSLSLSLGEIEKENPTACEVLRLLCFLGPDQITKPLLRQLLHAKRTLDDHIVDEKQKNRGGQFFTPHKRAFVACGLVLTGAAFILPPARRHTGGLFAVSIIAAASVFAVSGSAARIITHDDSGDFAKLKRPTSATHLFSAFEYEQADIAWDILKSFSLITVKEGKGSMHRLMSQAMRSCQSEEEARYHVTICVAAMRSMWTFKPEQTATWKESLQILEHAKSVVNHSLEYSLDASYVLKTAELSKEAGVFSAMALNAFIEAQVSLDISLKLLESARGNKKYQFMKAKAETLHELGRVLRYQASYDDAEKSLRASLKISHGLNRKDAAVRKGIADTLHELGVLEVKKHNLDSASSLLQQSLEMRRSSDQHRSNDTNANCAATLHQLAAIQVARKPPSLEKAKTLLQEALSLCQQIGQRAATLKQLARVSIRQGFLNKAETYLEQALELYLELYGDNKLHINIAAVKFQQGALALQREQLDQAWLHFSECLRIRRHVYAYARTVGSAKDANPIHLEVSCVLHELGGVGFAQKRFPQSMEMLQSEHDILEKLEETTTRSERLYQARLTNLTWLRKCAKEMGDEDEANRLSNERAAIKKRSGKSKEKAAKLYSDSITLQHKSIYCRSLARSFALEKDGVHIVVRENLLNELDELLEEISMAPPESMKRAATQFRDTVLLCIDKPITTESRVSILKACDDLRQVKVGHFHGLFAIFTSLTSLVLFRIFRDVLRAHGLQVNDSIHSRKKAH